MQDIYWSEPQAPYEQRRRLYLQYCAAHSLGGRDGFFCAFLAPQVVIRRKGEELALDFERNKKRWRQ